MDKITEWKEKYAEAYRALLEIDKEADTTRGKGYSLTKIPRKKLGYVYYVRYNMNGIEIPTKFTTHTNDRAAADLYARINRDRLIETYHGRKNNRNAAVYKILSCYYGKGSPYLETAKNRGRVFSEKTRVLYYNFINKVFIPYLEKNGIKTLASLTPPIIAKLQDYLLLNGPGANAINRYLGCVKAVFEHLIRDGIIKENPFNNVKALANSIETPRGCYEIDTLRGVFKKKWENETNYLLCALIYTTGLRNSEIERLRFGDIIKIKDRADIIRYFIDVKQSKTENGKRIVPLHPVIYEKITEYTKQNNKADYIFTKSGRYNQSTIYKKANADLGARLGLSEKELEKQGISFYSGRHYYKTLVSAAGLGEDVEEYFMGHKVSADVRKRYNHIDKRGEAALLRKASEVCAAVDILIKC